jgi:CHAT domain-containing protein
MSVSIKNFDQNMAVYGLYYDNLLRIKGLKLAALKNERQRLRKIHDPGQLEIIKKLDDIKNLIGKLYNFSNDERAKSGYDLSSLQTEANTLQAELNKNINPGNDSLIDLSITWQEVRKSLKKGEAAIEIFRFRPYDNGFLDSVIYLYLIVTPETMEHPEIGMQFNGKLIEGTAFQEYLDAARSVDVDSFEELDLKILKQAYNNYWLPIQYHLQGVNKIFLSADGLYHKINPAVLVNPSTKKYLYEEYEIELVGSTREIVTRNNKKQNINKGSWLFGYPELYDFKFPENKSPLNQESDRAVFSDDTKSEMQRYYLSDIPATKTEVEKIDSLLKNHNKESVLLTGVEANEKNIKNMKGPTILHIASHGYFIKDDEVVSDKIYGFDKKVVSLNPLLRSGLFLAGSGVFLESDPFAWRGDENGILTAQECLTLDLDKTELVTLSACETGLGIIQNGEGVYGLQRAFMVSGASSVIMSLWKVHDTATMEFMVSFYAGWLKSGDKIKAFDLARQVVREKYKLPYYWGAFIMMN